MSRLAALLALSLAACNPVDYVADKAGDRCEEAFEEKFPDVVAQIQEASWAICTNFYENVVMPAIEGEFAEAIDEMERRLRDVIEEEKATVLAGMGCTEDPSNPFGWDCAGTTICQ